MNSQKIVVVLLLVTIILSIVSVVLTFSTNLVGKNTVQKIQTNNQGPSTGQISFKIAPTSERGGIK